MRRIPTLLSVTALLSALVFWRARATHDAPPDPRSNLSVAPSGDGGHAERATELVALRARVIRLEQLVNTLQKQSASCSSTCAETSAPGLAGQAQAAAGSEAPPPAPDFMGTFDRDQRPAENTPRVAQLESRMKALLPRDASLDRLECRGEICRVELTLPGVKRYHEFVKSAFGNPETRVWSGATKFGYLSEPDPQHWEHDEISVYAYLGPQANGAEP